MDNHTFRRLWIWPAILVASSALAAWAVTLPGPGLVRPLAAFWFLLVCPGMAFVPLLGIGDRLVALTLGIALSLSLGVLVALGMLGLGVWSATLGLRILIGVSLAGAALQLLIPLAARATGRRRVVEAEPARQRGAAESGPAPSITEGATRQ